MTITSHYDALPGLPSILAIASTAAFRTDRLLSVVARSRSQGRVVSSSDARCAILKAIVMRACAIEDLTMTVDELARAVHAAWSASRLAAGWVCGAVGEGPRRSPYLKPYDHFTSVERRRDRLLALGDLLVIGRGRLRGLSIDTETPVLRARTLSLLADPPAPAAHLATASAVHAHWRRVNRALGTHTDDPRLRCSFRQLTEADQALALENVTADAAAFLDMLHAANPHGRTIVNLTVLPLSDRALLVT
jgi:hypothetical protein